MLDVAVEPTKLFRQALGTFATGVTVVTAIDEDGQPRGFTANSFTSVSLNPPLILICIASDSAGHAVFTNSDTFCINVLAEDQQELSTLFASPGAERFSGVEWHPGNNDNPIINGAISFFECDRHNLIGAGDHVILIGKVSNYETSGRSPLIYCAGSYVEFSLMQKAMEVPASGIKTRISALINCNDNIPMSRESASGKLSLPSAAKVGSAAEPASLAGKLAANGLPVTMPFIYAVYRDVASKTHNVVYRGSADSVDTQELKDFEFVSLDEIPWDDLVDDALRQLMQRYLEEYEHDAFGVYVGDTEQGKVHALSTAGE